LRPDDPLSLDALARLTAGGTISAFHALFLFERKGPIQTLVHEMKYGGMRRLALQAGMMIGEDMAAHAGAAGVSGVIPVPLHKAKLRERGYNQSVEIGRGIASVLGLPLLTHLIRRRRYTATQTSLDQAERERNVEGAFEVKPSRRASVGGRKFLVVDDVVTTGATLSSCGTALVSAGARECMACSLALAGPNKGTRVGVS
jgi:ComF family protein